MIKKTSAFVLVSFLAVFSLGAVSFSVRDPQVADSFYPADPDALNQMIDQFLGNTPPPESGLGELIALIVPHAGYIYSGQVAAYGYRLVYGLDIETVILIGPSHRAGFSGASIWMEGVWKTPLGEVVIDAELAQAIARENKMLNQPPGPHRGEHSLEVQIPFLQKTLKNFKIVPILLGDPSLGNSRIVARAVAKHIKDKKILIVCSTDMSHYFHQDKAQGMDRLALALMEKQDSKELSMNLLSGACELCGSSAVLTTLEIGKLIGGTKLKVLKHATSGDVTGDMSRVVGYGASVLYLESAFSSASDAAVSEAVQASADAEAQMEGTIVDVVTASEKELDLAQQKELLDIARKTLVGRISQGKTPEFHVNDPMLLEKQGAFVTLNEDGKLRGCIGHITAAEPLYQAIRDVTISAATEDPRFTPVTIQELEKIEIEISVLSVPKRVMNADEIEMGTHGVIVKKGARSGIFLPQVATETNWNKEDFLSELCSQKAGLSRDCWKDSGAELYTFTAQVFSEKEVH